MSSQLKDDNSVLQVLRHVAGLYSGEPIKHDPTELIITGHYVWLARKALEELSSDPCPCSSA